MPAKVRMSTIFEETLRNMFSLNFLFSFPNFNFISFPVFRDIWCDFREICDGEQILIRKTYIFVASFSRFITKNHTNRHDFFLFS